MSDTIHLPLAVATRLCAELDADEDADTPESNAAERMAYSGEYMVPTKVARRLERQRDSWEQTAAHYLDGMHYYRGLVERVGETLGEAAHTQDDGGKVDSVLCAKVPELVVELKRERDEARDDAQRKRVELNHLWQANEMAEQAFRERDAWRTMATELADAAAYGLAQWEQGYHLEVSRFTDSLIRFQKMQKEAEE